MDSFENMMKAACHIKQYQMSFDKQVFEKLPEFLKTGLYCCDMLNNVRIQKDFILKKSAFEAHSEIGKQLLSINNYDDAHYSFCKALCIFRFIINKNKNWKTEGVKDEELKFFDEIGQSQEEIAEIKKMKISALLNISLCDLNSGKFSEVRAACDEIIKLDNTNVKAYYRKAKSYLDCKQSLKEDYKSALEQLDLAVKYSQGNLDLKNMRDKLYDQIENENKEEKKVFKSFFRNVNYPLMKDDIHNDTSNNDNNLNLNKEDNIFTKVTDSDSMDGKPQIRVLNLVIEQCYIMIDRLEREGNRKDKLKIQRTVEQAKHYKEELQRLLELDFENPNDSLKEFASKNNVSLKDPNVKEEFFKIRKEYIQKINKFYEENLLMHGNEVMGQSKKIKKGSGRG